MEMESIMQKMLYSPIYPNYYLNNKYMIFLDNY